MKIKYVYKPKVLTLEEEHWKNLQEEMTMLLMRGGRPWVDIKDPTKDVKIIKV